MKDGAAVPHGRNIRKANALFAAVRSTDVGIYPQLSENADYNSGTLARLGSGRNELYRAITDDAAE
jgi:hypothetical protein